MSVLSNQEAEESWAKAEQNQRQDELRTQQHEERYPKRRMTHRFFVFVSIVTGVSSLLMCIGQLLGILFQTTGPIQYFLRIYVCVLCVLVVLIELEWTKMARESYIFSIWITRGIFICFIGLLGLEENDTSTIKNSSNPHFDASENYLKAVAWIMIGCGSLYFAMGILCLQLVYKRARKDYQERLARAPAARKAPLITSGQSA